MDFPCECEPLDDEQSPVILGVDLQTDEGVPLAVWGLAQVAATIMAASVPVMRVLIQQMTRTIQQSRLTSRFQQTRHQPSSGKTYVSGKGYAGGTRYTTRKESHIKNGFQMEPKLVCEVCKHREVTTVTEV